MNTVAGGPPHSPLFRLCNHRRAVRCRQNRRADLVRQLAELDGEIGARDQQRPLGPVLAAGCGQGCLV